MEELKPTDKQILLKVFMNSALWDDCVLEAYEGDVDDLIENILFAGFTRIPPATASKTVDVGKLKKFFTHAKMVKVSSTGEYIYAELVDDEVDKIATAIKEAIEKGEIAP